MTNYPHKAFESNAAARQRALARRKRKARLQILERVRRQRTAAGKAQGRR